MEVKDGRGKGDAGVQGVGSLGVVRVMGSESRCGGVLGVVGV